ncbi:MAG: HDOD domain-containing protein [Planctomycetales bacterium]
MHEVLIGRQPIYDAALEIKAYELLYRSNHENAAHIPEATDATGRMLVSALMDIGLDNLVGNSPAYINFSREYFTDENVLSLDKDRIVLEILETIEPDDDFVAAIRRYVGLGYKVALDDFVYDDRFRPLIDLASAVKIDIRMFDPAKLQEQINLVRQSGTKCLLAEKIETYEEFQLCKRLGFELFQGYFLSRPNIVRDKAVPSNQIAALQILAKMRDPRITFKELANIISQDIGLSYRLLQFCNSSAVGIGRKIESILQAVTLLGMSRLRMMVTLLTLKELNSKPLAVVQTAMMRARLCELLGTALDAKEVESFHLVGLFSALDTLMDRPLEEILPALPLSPEVTRGILHHEGRLGEALRCAISMERTSWEDSHCPGLSRDQIQTAYLQAVASDVHGELVS